MSDNEIYLNFFKELNKTLVDSSLKGINDILSNVSDTFNTFTQNSTNDLYDKENKEKSIHSLKKGTYYNLKNMYEKLSNTHDEILDNNENLTDIAISEISDFSQLDITVSNNQLTCNNLFSGFNKANDEGYDLYQIFNIIDRGNNDIGSKVLCDLNFLYENIYCNFNAESTNEQQSKPLGNLTEAAVYMLFSELATRSGFLFQQIPNYLNLNSRVTTNDEDLNTITDEMFGTHLDTELFGKSLLNNKNKSFGGITGLPGFIFQLGTVTTELNEDEYTIEKNVNNYNNSFQLDVGFNENKEIVCKTKNAPDDILKSNVTCFTVDFGGQKQQMFFNINLDTSQFFNTEEGIKTWVNLISKNQQTAVTTNIFPILETRSYTCTISSLGNATIQPLTYFYLRNVPLFNGTYWITNVTHDISPNTMITTFQGVRQPIASKSDSRQHLLNLMEQRSLELQKITNNIKTIKTTEMVESVGEIYKISDVDVLYGSVYQKRSDLLGYVEFNGKVLIGTYINMISGNNDTNIINKMVISYLYNRAKSICKTTDHKTIINTMIDIVIYDLKNLANRSDIRLVLNEKSKDLSLYQVYKESKFSEQSVLSELLTKIGENVDNYNSEITNTKLDRYNLQAKDSDDKPIQKNSKVIKISIPDNSSTSSDIPLSSITQILLHNIDFYGNTKFIGIDGGGSKNITLFDLFEKMGGTNGVNINGVITKTNGVDINGVNVSYLGSFINEDVSISCFSSSYKYSDDDIKKQKLSLKSFGELVDNSVITPTYPKPSSEQIEKNRVSVMEEFKRIYKNDSSVNPFIKEFIAGIMGNIQMESEFDVNAVNGDDKYGGVSYPSVGLFQFHSYFYGGGEKNAEEVFKKIGGHTVKGQINFLTRKNTEGVYQDSNYRGFMKLVREIKVDNYSNKDKLVEHLTYLFASQFERCQECDNENSKVIKTRKGDALGFYNDMKKENSYLYYNNE